MSAPRPAWTVRLFAAALLLGGLRDPRAFAVGGLLLAAALFVERPAFGPAAAWAPWLAWAFASTAACAAPFAAWPVLARGATALGAFSLAAAWDKAAREEWLKLTAVGCVLLAVAALWTGRGSFRSDMTGLLPPYYNYTAFALAATGAACAAWALHPKGPRGRVRAALFAVAGLAAVCVLLSGSRGGLWGLAAAAAAWSARRWGRRAARPLATVAAGGLMLAALSPALRGYAFDKNRTRGEARPGIWRAALAVAEEKPLFGEGPGSFAAGFRRHPVAAPGAAALYGLNADYAHSEPLNALAETGWLGLLLWLAALAASARALAGPADAEPAREAAAVAAASMAAQLFVDDFLQIPGLAILFFSALAVAAPRPAGGARWSRAAAVAVGLLALTAGLPRALAARDLATAAWLYPNDPGPVEDLAYAASGVGWSQDADPLWARAAALAPYDAVYPWRRGQIAGAKGDWASAEAFAARAQELEPGFARARLLRAAALVRLGRAAEARAALSDLNALLASPPRGAATSGYERTVSGFDDDDRRLLEGVRAAAYRTAVRTR